MSNFVINEEIKCNILNLYFKDNKTMKEIEQTTGISRNSISKILHQDIRFFEEKEKRKESKLRQPQTNKVNFNKNGNSYSTKINIPYLYFKKMGIDKENRLVDVIYDENKKEIILKNIQKNKKYVIIFLAIYKSKGRCEKMNFNEEEQKLLSEANVLVETNKTYTDDEVKGFSNKIVEHIMTFSKTDIPKVKSKFDPILFKIS